MNKHILRILIIVLACATPSTSEASVRQPNNWEQQTKEPTDKDILNKAVDYFQSGKYHEALLMFHKLSHRYQLNTRFKAYIGVCYFYDNQYESCAEVIDSVSTELGVFAPHEQSVYYYCAAESHLQTKSFVSAIDYFERVLLLCYDNEKSNVLSKLAQCYEAMDMKDTAQEYFDSAKAYINQYKRNK